MSCAAKLHSYNITYFPWFSHETGYTYNYLHGVAASRKWTQHNLLYLRASYSVCRYWKIRFSEQVFRWRDTPYFVLSALIQTRAYVHLWPLWSRQQGRILTWCLSNFQFKTKAWSTCCPKRLATMIFWFCVIGQCCKTKCPDRLPSPVSSFMTFHAFSVNKAHMQNNA